MAELQCVICDFSVEASQADDEVLALLGTSSPDAGKALVAHMEAHTLIEWIRAFKMADAYIEKLETQLEQAESSATELARLPRPVYAPPADYGSQDYAEPYQPGPEDQELAHFFTPKELEARRRRQQIRAAVDIDPDQTLIPRIPDAQRPEGVVGVKY